jgi:acyl-CoA oxidase
MLIAQGAVDACKIGVTIAVRYAAQRPQFGGKYILEYLTHQRRLFPALATTYAMHIALMRLKVTRAL